MSDYSMRTKRAFENYTDLMGRVYPLKDDNGNIIIDKEYLSRVVTFQVTDACNLACSYCYQINKGTKVMKFEDAKKLIDMLLTNDMKMNNYLHLDKCPAIVIDFIGGEPLLEIELIDKICDYFIDKAIELHHPWAIRHIFQITSNGVLYFDPKVQKFLDKRRLDLSLSITLDGNKDLHDSCRKFPDGRPSYDYALAAIKDYQKRGGYMGSKITIAPGNLNFLYDAIVHMVELGYKDINANVVFEKGWEPQHNLVFYNELKRIADYLLDGNYDDISCSLFEEFYFRPSTENGNWCGGTGNMLSLDPDGFLYPCIRYMDSSLGGEQPAYFIGHVDTGIAQTEEEMQKVKCLNCITRRSQSTDECFYCPIATGCAWCSGYNYQVNGTPDSRVTYICDLHKARALANVYFWNKYYKKNKIKRIMPCNCPKEWALQIISEEEYNMLQGLTEEGKEC